MLPLAALLLGLAAGQADPWQEEGEDEERRPRVFISAWGGNAWDLEQDGGDGAVFGGELAYALRSFDLALAGFGYRLPDQDREWTPVGLVRLLNRFQTGRGVEATFGVGVGAARGDDWMAWFQVALGVRVDLGPLFLGGELSFERSDLLRLAGGIGVKL